MIPEHQTLCPYCKQHLKQYQFKQHVKNCNKFDGIALKQIKRLPKNLPVLQLKLIIAELDICRQLVQQQITGNKKNGIYNKKSYIDDNHKNDIGQSTSSTDIVDCKKCKKKFYASFDTGLIFYVEECWHLFCTQCIKKYIEQQFVNQMGNLVCMYKGCPKTILQYQIKQLVGEKKFDELEKAAIRKMQNIVQCVKCHSQYGFMPGNPRDAPSKDNNGKVLTETDKKNYAQNRFICSKTDCKSQQCKECQAIPFHIGMTCKQYKSRAQMKKCRYCDEPLTSQNKSNTTHVALQDICNKKQCQGWANDACTKILPCGHPCCGLKGQAKCLPCLRQECCKDNIQLNGQKGDDYCNVCFIQSLSSAPCVRSNCGHIFHQKCLKKRYEIRWITPRIFFNFCLCPLCKKWIEAPPQCRLTLLVNKNLDTFNRIQKMSQERLKFQGCDKDQKLKDPKSPYYGKPKEYAMAIYAYFQCFKCKNPYFGGRKNCAQAMDQPQNSGQFKPQQWICPNCCEIPIQNCPKHGKDFIQFKCKFCCSTAQWFCWGNTHFCQSCHKRQCNKDYVSKYPKQKLPVCPGPKLCPIGGNHNGNGQQKTLGCTICRNYKANNKNF